MSVDKEGKDEEEEGVGRNWRNIRRRKGRKHDRPFSHAAVQLKNHSSQ